MTTHSYSTYNNLGCRCDICVAAWNAYCAGRKSVRRVPGLVLDSSYTHGLPATYQAGCTCSDCKKAHSRYSMEQRYFKKNPEIFEELYTKQAGKCACCHKEPRNNKLVVDHIHGTKIVRGLLCSSCNSGIGKLGDTLEGIQNALEYLT